MGTSSDFAGGSGGAWTGYKRAASSLPRAAEPNEPGGCLHGTSERSAALAELRAERRLEVAGSNAWVDFSPALPRADLPAGLRLGLGHLIGQRRYDVLAALIAEIAGNADDLEAAAARSAVLDVLDELLPEGDHYASLEDLQLDAQGVRDALQRFLAAYVYNRAAPIIEERLNRLDPQVAEARDAEIREYARSLVELNMQEIDPMQIDWSGEGGRNTSEALLRDLYEYIEALDE
jgi:hypothetical protein